MAVISNGTTLIDAGALDSGVPTGSMKLIKSITASSDSTISFVNGASSVVLELTMRSPSILVLPATCSVDSGFSIPTPKRPVLVMVAGAITSLPKEVSSTIDAPFSTVP